MKHPIQIISECILDKMENGEVCKSCGRPLFVNLPCTLNAEHQAEYVNEQLITHKNRKIERESE